MVCSHGHSKGFYFYKRLNLILTRVRRVFLPEHFPNIVAECTKLHKYYIEMILLLLLTTNYHYYDQYECIAKELPNEAQQQHKWIFTVQSLDGGEERRELLL